jgi:hypothetical protein
VRKPPARERDVCLELGVALLAGFCSRREQTEVLQLSRKPRVDAGALAQPVEVELGLVRRQAGRSPPLAIACCRRG